MYALKTPGKNYPFSVTQLPRCLKAVALGKNFQQMDDSNAFQRIVFQHTSVQSVKDQINELIDGKEQVYDQILSQGDFKSWVTHATIKETINALANGQSIYHVRRTLGASGAWLDSWAKGNKLVTDEICDKEHAQEAIELIEEHFPTKTRRGKQVQRDARLTWRSAYTAQFEALGMREKYRFY